MMLTHPAFDVSHLAGYSAYPISYGFNQSGTMTTSVSGTGSVTTVGPNDYRGPAMVMIAGASPATAQFTGTSWRPDSIKAVIMDVEGFYTNSETGTPLWGMGFYGSDGSVSELFRDATGVALTTQIINDSQRSQTKTAMGHTNIVNDASIGLMIDYTNGMSHAHMGYSVISTSGNQPTVNLEFRMRVVANASHQNFSIFVRKATLTIIK